MVTSLSLYTADARRDIPSPLPAHAVGVVSPGLLASPQGSECVGDEMSDEEWEEQANKCHRRTVRIKLPYNRNTRYDTAPGGSGGRGKRRVRCMQCPACLRTEDCGECDFCRWVWDGRGCAVSGRGCRTCTCISVCHRDKPKFGGPGIKKQACM